MTIELNAAKKKLFRKNVLQFARELYLHPQTDSQIAHHLKANHPLFSLAQVRELFNYLAQKELVIQRRKRNSASITITPRGIDLLDGAISVRGVEPSESNLASLGYKRELRRGILQYCYSFNEFFNEDTEIFSEFKNSGFSNLLLEEIRFHIWYLRQKSFLDLKSISIGGDLRFMARITARGMDVVEKSVTDAGVHDDAE